MLIDDTRVVPLTLLMQTVLTLALAGTVWIGWGNVAGFSVLLGGVVAVIPNAFLAARLLTPRALRSAEALMRSAWIGAIGKLVLTALLFGTIFALVRPLSPAAVFGGFIAAQLVVFGALGSGPRPTGLTTKS